MNAWFVAMKGTSDERKLFSKLGIHWTVYGSLLAADSITRYIEQQRNIDLPSLSIKAMHFSDTPKGSDDDIARGVNLLSPCVSERLCYPEYIYDTGGGQTTKPKIIFIGDSFTWPLMNNGFMQGVSNDWEVWYYFKEVWKQSSATGNGERFSGEHYDWLSAILKADCIVTIYSLPNVAIYHYKNAFTDILFSHFYPQARRN